MMDGPGTRRSAIFMLFFIGLCAPADMVKSGEARQKKRG